MDGTNRHGWNLLNKCFGEKRATSARTSRHGWFESLEARHLLTGNALFEAPVQYNNPSPGAHDGFGIVAIDNGRTVVGVPNDDSAGENAGVAYIYLDETSPPIAVQSPDAHAHDRFGANVAIAGLKVAVAESGDTSDDETPAAGSVHLYDIPSATWLKIQHPDPHKDSQFGANGLALTSEVLLVSSNNLSTGTPVTSKVYALNPTDGSTLRSFSLPGPQRPVVSEIDVDGDWVLIGSSDYESIYTTTDIGRAFLWNWRTGDSIAIENPTPAQDDFFGESVAIDGSTIAISAPGDDTDGVDHGLVYLYTFDSTTGTLSDPSTVSNLDNPSGVAALPSTPNFEQGFAQSIEIDNGLVFLGSVYASQYSLLGSIDSRVTVVDTQGFVLEHFGVPQTNYFDIIQPGDQQLVGDDLSLAVGGTVRFANQPLLVGVSDAPQLGIDIAVDTSTGTLVVADRTDGIGHSWASGSMFKYKPAYGNTFVVNSTDDAADSSLGDRKAAAAEGKLTLRAAIQESNASDGDALIILPPGQYNLTMTGNGAAAGDLDVTSDITLVGAGAGMSIIDASAMTGERIFDVMGSLKMSGVTLTGANISAGQNGLGGGAIWVRSMGKLELNHSVISGNTAGSIGGGIYNAGELMVNRSVISQNSSAGHGGGIRNVGTAQVNGSVIARNSGNPDGPDLRGHFSGDNFNLRTSDTGSFGLQGASRSGVDLIVTEFVDHVDSDEFDASDLSLREAIITANAAGGPVTIWLPSGQHHLNLTGSGDQAGDLDITGEVTIVGAGAGVTVIDASGMTGERIFDVTGTLSLEGLTLTGADIREGTNGMSGGAIWVRESGTVNLHESTVTGNMAAKVGGGIYNAGTLNITDSVITNNRSCGVGGGIRSVGMTTVSNTIIANNNSDLPVGRDVFGRFNSDGTNLLTNSNGSTDFRFDHIGRANSVVTSIEDRLDHSDDHYALTLREAVDHARSYREIWLPAWLFRLSIKGEGGIEVGSLDIDDYRLAIRGISDSETTVDATAIVDEVFDVTTSRFYQYDLTTIDG